jgi:hypothetical protein
VPEICVRSQIGIFEIPQSNAEFVYLFSSAAKFIKSSPVTVLEWPRRFQEVKVPIFHDNGTGWW